MHALKQLWTGLNKGAEIVIVLTIAVIAVSMTTQVVARYVFNNPFVGNEEVSMYLLLWVCFIGAGYGVTNRIHIRMTTLVRILPLSMQKYIALTMNLITFGGFLYIYPFAIDFFTTSKDAVSPGLQVPMHYYIVCLPIGLAFLLLSLIVEMVRIIRDDLPTN